MNLIISAVFAGVLVALVAALPLRGYGFPSQRSRERFIPRYYRYNSYDDQDPLTDRSDGRSTGYDGYSSQWMSPEHRWV